MSAMTLGSSYSLHDTPLDDDDYDKDYGQVRQVDEDDRTPLKSEFGDGGPGGFVDPDSFSIPTSGYSSRMGRGLTRKETNAIAFRQRQRDVGRTKTKKVVLSKGHFIK